jgi:hypothetical protein
MKLVSSGDIWRIFKDADPGTIVRRPNLRRFAKENGIEHYVIGDKWLINKDEFIKALTPQGDLERQSMPRMRCIRSAVNEWNSTHKRVKIDKHVIERCMASEKVFKMKRELVWIINYDQLEPIIKGYMKTHVYIPMEKRKKKSRIKKEGGSD